MGLKNLHIKVRKKKWIKNLKAFWLRRFFNGDKRKSQNVLNSGNVASWMAPVTHGFHIVDSSSFGYESSLDSVVVQREQIEELEVWFFGVSDDRIGDKVTKYMQVHLFDKKPKKSQLQRMSKEAIRRAYLDARSNTKEAENGDDMQPVGSASAIVINGDKLVIANVGDHKAVVCRDGKAYQINRKRQDTNGRHWSRKILDGVFQMPKESKETTKPLKGSEFVIGDEKIDRYTEFVILASPGIWEVMKHQEAVNLIRHIEDPQEAAECLTKEALTRISRSSISCLVIRFE